MSLLDKSHENKNASSFLKDKALRNSAVHCCYYSCYQKIVHVLKVYYTSDFDRLDVNKRGSHNTIIDLFLQFYFDLKFNESANEFSRKISQLKDWRHIADYESNFIEESVLNKAIEYMNRIHTLLDKDLQL